MASLSLGAFKQLQPTATSMPDVGTGIVALSVGCVSIHLGPEEADKLALELQRAAQQLRAESQGAAA